MDNKKPAIMGQNKRHHSPDIFVNSEQPQSPSVLHPKVEKHQEKEKHRPECFHCMAIQRDEKDQRNVIFSLLIKEEMKNIKPCTNESPCVLKNISIRTFLGREAL